MFCSFFNDIYTKWTKIAGLKIGQYLGLIFNLTRGKNFILSFKIENPYILFYECLIGDKDNAKNFSQLCEEN